jgi:hypothetical protein
MSMYEQRHRFWRDHCGLWDCDTMVNWFIYLIHWTTYVFRLVRELIYPGIQSHKKPDQDMFRALRYTGCQHKRLNSSQSSSDKTCNFFRKNQWGPFRNWSVGLNYGYGSSSPLTPHEHENRSYSAHEPVHIQDGKPSSYLIGYLQDGMWTCSSQWI